MTLEVTDVTLKFLEEARSYINQTELKEIPKRVKHFVEEHDKWRVQNCINMIASENILSPTAKELFATDFASRTAQARIGARMYKGYKYLDPIEALVVELAKKLYRARFVDHRPTSGATANAVAFGAFTKPSHTIMSLPLSGGGHISYRKYGVAGYHGLKVVDIPFDIENYEIDLNGFETVAKATKPKLIVVGASLILFPYPLKQIKEIANEVYAKVIYDGAHIMGLIAGGEFQDPLTEGADVLTGSTHKTFPCGLGGWLFWNDEELTPKIDFACHPGLVSTHGPLNRVVSMAVVLAEMLAFGKEYAAQVVRNAKALAKALDEDGFDPLYRHKGYTESHQVAVDVSKLGRGEKVASILESSNVICNKNVLPWDKERQVEEPSGLRLGVAEVTRLGMKEREMERIAEFMRRAVIDKENPEKMAKAVTEFRRDYQKVRYCFD